MEILEYGKLHQVRAKYMGEEFYFAMIETLEEERVPLERVQSLDDKEGTRDPNGWRAILSDAVGINGPRLAGLAKLVNAPGRVRKYEDVPQAIENALKRREAKLTTIVIRREDIKDKPVQIVSMNKIDRMKTSCQVKLD